MKVRSVLLILALAMSCSTSCGVTSARHISTVSVVAAHATLSAIQDTELLLACGKPNAPAPPACIPEATHKEISAKLVTAFDADGKLARAVRDWPVGQPPPATLGQLLAQIQQVVQYVLAHLPNGAIKTKLLTTIGG